MIRPQRITRAQDNGLPHLRKPGHARRFLRRPASVKMAPGSSP
jgi:hypothetical protein